MSVRSGACRRTHRLDRVRAFVKIQDGCSFSCAFCVIPLVRGSTRSRTAAAVLARDPASRRAGTPRGRAHGRQPRGASAIAAAGLDAGRADPGGGRDRGPRAPAAVVDRGQPRHPRADRPRCARRRRRAPPARPAAVGGRRRAPRDGPPLHDRAVPGADRAARRLQSHDRRDRRLPGRGRGGVRRTRWHAVAEVGITKVHVFPYSPRPGTRTAADDPVPREVKRERSARLRAASEEACRARWASRVGSERRRPRRSAGTGLRRRLHAVARRCAGRHDGARTGGRRLRPRG